VAVRVDAGVPPSAGSVTVCETDSRGSNSVPVVGNVSKIWMLIRVRVATLGFGPKEGWVLLSALPSATQIGSGDWRVAAQQAYRVLALRPKREACVRARAARNVTVWRSYRNEVASQSIWIRLIPFVSASDAQSELARLPDSLLRKPFWKLIRSNTDSADDFGADTGLRYSEVARGPRGREVTTTILAGTVSSMLVVLDFSTTNVAWEEPHIASIAIDQMERTRALLSASD
jgi:hypothetical protein